MGFHPTPIQRDLIERAAAAARVSPTPRAAAMYDQTGAYPRESWHDLWKQAFWPPPSPESTAGYCWPVTRADRRHVRSACGGDPS